MWTCVCVQKNTHAHTQTLTFPPQTALPNSLFLSLSLRLCLCRLLLKPPSLPLALCWSAHGRLSIKARLLPSELPGMDLPAPGSNTPRQFDSRGYYMVLPVSFNCFGCVWVNGRFKVQVFAALRTSLKISGWINRLHFCIYRKYRVAPGLKIAKITGKQFSSYQLMHLLCLLAGCE